MIFIWHFVTHKDRMMELHLTQLDKSENTKQVAYLSREFLIGPQLGNNLVNLGIQRGIRQALEQYDLTLDEVLEKSEEPKDWVMEVLVV